MILVCLHLPGQKHRDRDSDVISQSESLNFNESTPIQPQLIWKEFIANRTNKKRLVNLIVSNLKTSHDMLDENQELFIA